MQSMTPKSDKDLEMQKKKNQYLNLKWNGVEYYVHKFKYSGQKIFSFYLEEKCKQNAKLSNSPVKTCKLQQVKGKIVWF